MYTLDPSCLRSINRHGWERFFGKRESMVALAVEAAVMLAKRLPGRSLFRGVVNAISRRSGDSPR
jgi:hypothetical protein